MSFGATWGSGHYPAISQCTVGNVSVCFMSQVRERSSVLVSLTFSCSWGCPSGWTVFFLVLSRMWQGSILVPKVAICGQHSYRTERTSFESWKENRLSWQIFLSVQTNTGIKVKSSLCLTKFHAMEIGVRRSGLTVPHRCKEEWTYSSTHS